MQYLTTTYTEKYAIRDARRMRDLVESEWYQARWGELVRLSSRGERYFANDARGFRQAVPFQSLTSGRGDRLIIDDPHSLDTVESEADLERVIRRFRETVPDRINDPRTSAIVIVMHRLSEKDICAVIDRLRMPYVNVILPMEFEPDRKCITPIGKDPRTVAGELLFPGRWPRDVVERDKLALTEHAWSAQKQQRPTARGGNLFQRQWFEIVEASPAHAKRVRAWDLAATKRKVASENPSWTVGVRMAKDRHGIYYIEDVARFREGGETVEDAIVNLAKSDNATHAPVRIRLPQDPGQAGKSQCEYLARKLAGYTVIAKPVTGSKETRAEPFASQCKAGNVKLVNGPWLEKYLDEVVTFPRGLADDQVDASADAFMELALGSSYDLRALVRG